MRVGANAGVFRKFAIRAIRKVERELFDGRFGVGVGLDLDDNREVVALGAAQFLFCKS
jgi:hypothetical protein